MARRPRRSRWMMPVADAGRRDQDTIERATHVNDRSPEAQLMAREWREHDKGLIRLKREQEHLEQSLKLQLAATVTAELVAENEKPERPGRRRGLRT